MLASCVEPSQRHYIGLALIGAGGTQGVGWVHTLFCTCAPLGFAPLSLSSPLDNNGFGPAEQALGMTWHSGHVMSTAWHICRLHLHTLSSWCVCVPVFVCRIRLGASQGCVFGWGLLHALRGRPRDVLPPSGLLPPNHNPCQSTHSCM
jgi:hypothetical protein